MGNKLYVGNLAYSVRDESLQQAFGQFGSVTSAKVMMDRETGRSKGFGFVEMSSPAEAQAAMNAMNGQPLEGRAIERGVILQAANDLAARADVLVVESTYGDRLHRPLQETIDELAFVVGDTLRRRQGIGPGHRQHRRQPRRHLRRPRHQGRWQL